SHRNYGGVVPEPGEIDAASLQLLAQAVQTLADMGDALGRCSFKEALRAAMSLARAANKYLDDKAPWKVIKQSREEAAKAVYTVMGVLSALSTGLYPILPFSSEKLHASLGFQGTLMERGWKMELPAAGQALREPQTLFVKLDDAVIEEETARLGQS
ncbi:class I tRNA ligase family protein, partial [Candidatus Bipolaricaulota bacterium]|nr:class I tRNA ligase family protein [Candidatus Bipolaricaulota bacterium]